MIIYVAKNIAQQTTGNLRHSLNSCKMCTLQKWGKNTLKTAGRETSFFCLCAVPRMFLSFLKLDTFFFFSVLFPMLIASSAYVGTIWIYMFSFRYVADAKVIHRSVSLGGVSPCMQSWICIRAFGKHRTPRIKCWVNYLTTCTKRSESGIEGLKRSIRIDVVDCQVSN